MVDFGITSGKVPLLKFDQHSEFSVCDLISHNSSEIPETISNHVKFSLHHLSWAFSDTEIDLY